MSTETQTQAQEPQGVVNQDPAPTGTSTTSTTTDPKPAQSQTQSPEQVDIESIYRKAQGLAYGNIDATLAELGIEKPAGIKTSDFIKQQFQELMQAKNTQTSQQTDSQEPNEWEMKAKAYQQQLQKLEEDRKNIEKNFYQKQADMMLDATISTLSIPAPPIEDDLREDWLQTQRIAIKTRFANEFEAKTINGQIAYFPKGSDTPLMNNVGDFAKPAEIIKDKYKSFFIDFGTANKPNGVRTNDVNVKPTNKFKNTSEIHFHLKEKGLILGKKEYQDEFNKLAKESNIMF